MATTKYGSPRDLTHAWLVPMAIGILLLIGGALAFGASMTTGLITVLYIGGMLVLVGVLEMIATIRVRQSTHFGSHLFAGVIAILVGGLILYRPLASLASLTLLIAGYMFAGGLMRASTAISLRYRGWGWDLGYAAFAIALGLLVAASWPLSSFWLLGTLVAIEIIARGIALVAAAWTLRDVERERLLVPA